MLSQAGPKLNGLSSSSPGLHHVSSDISCTSPHWLKMWYHVLKICWLFLDCWPFHPWSLHQPDPSSFQGAKTASYLRPQVLHNCWKTSRLLLFPFYCPRLLILFPTWRADHQPLTEASYANIPIVALSNIDSPTKFIDIAVPCNNKSSNSIGLMWWMLAREVLRLRGSISRDTPWEVVVKFRGADPPFK